MGRVITKPIATTANDGVHCVLPKKHHMNKLIITGRLTRDAELRYIPNGTPVLSFSVANNTGFGDNEKTQFFDCSLFGKRAEGKLKEFMKKGKQVLVEGEVSIKTYKKQDGSNGASLNVLVGNVELIGGNSPAESGGDYAQSPQNAPSPKAEYMPTGTDADFDDDVPF